MTIFRFIKSAALTVLLSLGAAPAFAQTGSLTTLYAHNNTFAGNTFDIQPTVDMTIDSFDVNIGNFQGVSGAGAGVTATVSIYWRPGTSDGFQNNSAGWTLLGTANVTSQGTNLPTNVPIGGLNLLAGETYGIYVSLDNHDGSSLSLLYTNGGPSAYSNTDLALTTFYGKGTPVFTGGTFTFRQWNGTIHYHLGITPVVTCASEGYTGTKLTWCQNICEKGYTGATLDMWIHRWVNRYRDLPYCAREGNEEPPPQES